MYAVAARRNTFRCALLLCPWAVVCLVVVCCGVPGPEPAAPSTAETETVADSPIHVEIIRPDQPAPVTVSRTWDFSGKCVGVADGDTITVMHLGQEEKIRLHGIDCPEKNQAFGTRAKQYTSSLAFGQKVSVVVKDTDRYGRTVGMVYLPDGRILNVLLVTAGLAWWYRQYAPDDTLLEGLEIAARQHKRGLWSDPHVVAPWDFRKGGGRAASQQPALQQPAQPAGDTVYIGDSGTKYHRFNCRTLTGNKHPISLSQAQAQGRQACKVCGP